jgi:5-methyltetrahydrofolate--homocysteine methyltransferase
MGIVWQESYSENIVKIKQNIGRGKMEKQQYQEALLMGNTLKIENLVRDALEKKISPRIIINEALIPAMEVVGEKFKTNEIFLPEVMMAARAMQVGLKIVKPLLTGEQRDYVGRVVIGTVYGDHHDIGKNLVGMMLEGAGFEVIDLGADVSIECFLEALQRHKPDILGLSSLLTTTMPAMKEIILAVEKAGLRDEVKIMIGGAPVTQEYADRINADGYSPDAGSAVELAKKLCKK